MLDACAGQLATPTCQAPFLLELGAPHPSRFLACLAILFTTPRSLMNARLRQADPTPRVPSPPLTIRLPFCPARLPLSCVWSAPPALTCVLLSF